MILYGKVPCLILYIFLFIGPIEGKSAQDLNNISPITTKNFTPWSTRSGSTSSEANKLNHTQPLNDKRLLKQTQTCLISVNIKERESTDDVYYEHNESTGTHTFTPKHGCLIKKVTKGNKVLWDSKDFNHQYGAYVCVGVNEHSEPVFRVYFPKTELVLDFQEFDPKLISVDLKHKNSNGFFSYKYDAKLRTHIYTPNPPYVFYRATKGDHLIWSHEDGDYPEHLLIMPDESGQPILRVLFPKSDGKIKAGEVEVLDPLEGIEIITEGSLRPNDSKKYTVNTQKNISIFRFNDGVKCTEVRYMGQKVWSHGDFGYEEYPQSIGYFTHQIIDVYMGGPLIFYERDPDGVWNGKESDILIYVEDPRKPNKIKQISVDQYDLRVEYGDVDYLFYKGVNCRKVMYKDETIWKYEGDEYPISLTYIEDKMIYIYFSNIFLLYIRDEDGEWTQHCSDDIYKRNRDTYKSKSGSGLNLFKWVEKYY